ncbi:hypothetical protein GGE65_007651 [Skermanella aerolata]|uniref:BCAM0308 family protein n=1 Tax=Skermanella aerolata TaxID=393310 RepID=UPI003D24FACC
MKEGHISPRLTHRVRRIGGRAQDTHIDDPYKRTEKLHDPSICSQCGAIYHSGRWHWGAPPVAAIEVECQACQRINDQYPAGILTLSGTYLRNEQHRSEILNSARHQEELEKAEHPLNRIMGVESQDDEIVITTTDIHLPRRIGEAVHQAHHGDLSFHYDEDGYFVRVNWRRDS